jgi:outer membrane receptor protein involved in Fe transport
MKNLVLLSVLSIFVCTAFAQTTSVSGVVKDQNSAVIAGATVTLRNSQAKQNNVTVSNQNGEFRFNNIAFGNYELKVSADGFTTSNQSFTLSNSDTTFNIVLSVADSKYSVTAEMGSKVDKDTVPQSITLVGKREIEERTRTVLGQVVNEEVGVAFQQTSPTIGGIFVRGLTGKNVNVYVDGVRYTHAGQRGGINTFMNLNEPSNLQSVEILRGANAAQYGSDSLGGTISLLSHSPNFDGKFHGQVSTNYTSSSNTFGANTLFSFGTDKFGGYTNLASRRVNNLKTAKGLDTHAAVTRFLGLPSDIIGKNRLPDTSFTQYGGAFRLNFSPRSDQQGTFYYQRNQQDGGKRYDQLLGGDGNLIADLRNLMGDFGYFRYSKNKVGFFDNASATVSYNSQREERVNQGGQGNPFSTITHQYERTSVIGFNGFLDKTYKTSTFLLGGDFYGEKVNAPAFTVNPVNNSTVISRPRVPDEAKFNHGGIYLQNATELFDKRLRVSGAVRYGVANYKVRQSDSPIVSGQPLWRDDSQRFADWSGRIGAVVRIVDNFRFAFNYTRGFRYPSVTDLGTLGLTGDGFEVDYTSAIGLGGTIGSTADNTATNTGISVAKMRSEYTNGYDFSFRWSNKRIETDFTVFRIDLQDTITKQALILPLGSVGRTLGDQVISSQLSNGVVFVPASTTPVLVRANFGDSLLYGFEYELEARIRRNLSLRGNYTFIHAEDKATGLPPNIEGGTPPPTAFLSLKYEPTNRYWFETYMTYANKQDRLSSLDLADRRTGATRTRAQIQNYFRRGACVLGLVNNPNGICGSGDETILLATGETLLQVQNRLLGSANSAPMFTYLPSYFLFNVRGGFKLNEKNNVTWAFENIFDRQYRNPSWGIDGAGRSVSFQYQYKF